jgi:hypothetical protein
MMEEFFGQRAGAAIYILLDEIAGMGLVGLILASVGLYGLMTHVGCASARLESA